MLIFINIRYFVSKAQNFPTRLEFTRSQPRIFPKRRNRSIPNFAGGPNFIQFPEHLPPPCRRRRNAKNRYNPRAFPINADAPVSPRRAQGLARSAANAAGALSHPASASIFSAKFAHYPQRLQDARARDRRDVAVYETNFGAFYRRRRSPRGVGLKPPHNLAFVGGR